MRLQVESMALWAPGLCGEVTAYGFFFFLGNHLWSFSPAHSQVPPDEGAPFSSFKILFSLLFFLSLPSLCFLIPSFPRPLFSLSIAHLPSGQLFLLVAH